MSESQAKPVVIKCTRCEQSMSVAPEHMSVDVACPHCAEPLQPWRLAAGQQGRGPAGNAPYAPPPHYNSPGYPGYQIPSHLSSRSRVVAGLLGIFLGYLGIHRFYLGYTAIGVIQIIVTIVTMGAGFIWGFIEGIVCFAGGMTDADGRELRD